MGAKFFRTRERVFSKSEVEGKKYFVGDLCFLMLLWNVGGSFLFCIAWNQRILCTKQQQNCHMAYLHRICFCSLLVALAS